MRAGEISKTISRSTTTIVVSRRTHDALLALGRKGETFDQVLAELLKLPGQERPDID